MKRDFIKWTSLLDREKVVRYFERLLEETNGVEFMVLDGEDGKFFTEYSYGDWLIIFRDSKLFDLLDGWNSTKGQVDWSVYEKLEFFLDRHGYRWEHGDRWNINIIKK